MGTTAKFGARLPDSQALALLNQVFRAGSTQFDTAEFAQVGNTFSRRLHEGIIGRFVSTLPRTQFTLATKFTPKEGVCDAKIVREDCDASLQRLGLEYVDLYYLNAPASLENVLAFMEVAKELVTEGKIKFIGMCNTQAVLDPAWIRAAHEIHPLSVVQQEWSLSVRGCEEKVVPVCAELGIGMVAFSPLARKLFHAMDGKTEDRKRDSFMLEQLNKLAASKSRRGPVTIHSLSIAWVYKQASLMGVDVVCIPGTSKASHAIANINACRINLSAQEMEFILRAPPSE
jgi:aryl-alcohol dehydrogenase-like predicted oxidoreductase